MPLRSPSAFANKLPEHDADVFHRVVLIHIQIALGVQLQIEAAMLGEQLQHVIEETDTGGDLVAAVPFDLQDPLICVSFVIALDASRSH